MPQTILEMAKDLAMAQIQAGALPPDEMHRELQKTYANLADLRVKEDLGESGGGLITRGGEDLSSEGDVVPTTSHWKRSYQAKRWPELLFTQRLNPAPKETHRKSAALSGS